MGYGIFEHPQVSCALRTGYPLHRKAERCEHCGGEAEVYSTDGGLFCSFCALDGLDRLSDEKKLELLGFEKIF